MRSLPRCTSLKIAGCSAVACQKRTEYWAFGLTGRTQRFTQGDIIPRLDVPMGVTNSNPASGALNGSNTIVEYTSDNIFSAKDYSAAEKEQYMSTHKCMGKWAVTNKLEPEDSAKTVELFARLKAAESGNGMQTFWFDPLLKDFPSMRKTFTSELQTEFTNFFSAMIEVAHDTDRVAAIARPFVASKLESHFITLPAWWRIAEHLMVGLERLNGSLA